MDVSAYQGDESVMTASATLAVPVELSTANERCTRRAGCGNCGVTADSVEPKVLGSVKLQAKTAGF